MFESRNVAVAINNSPVPSSDAEEKKTYMMRTEKEKEPNEKREQHPTMASTNKQAKRPPHPRPHPVYFV